MDNNYFSFPSSYISYDSNATIPNPEDSPVLFYVNTVVCILGIVFNCILIAICQKLCRRKHGSGRGLICGRAYFFVMWLCVCNLLFLAYRSVFRQLFNKANDQISTDAECKLYNAFEVIAQGFAIFTLVALSLDRYVVVRTPRRGSTLVIRYRYIILLFILLLSTASSIPILIYGRINHGSGNCEYIMQFSPHALAYEILRSLIMYAIPLLLIAIFYVEMAVILYRSRHSSAWQNSTNRQERTRQRNRLALSVLLITIIFGVCHFPINLGMCLQEIYIFHYNHGTFLTDLGRPLVYINACTHPIVVLVINRAVRNEIMRFFGIFSRQPERRNTSQTVTIESLNRLERNTQTYAMMSINDSNSTPKCIEIPVKY